MAHVLCILLGSASSIASRMVVKIENLTSVMKWKDEIISMSRA